jgi:hypothetical protein
MSGSSHVSLSFSGPVVHEKKIFKWPHPIFALLWSSMPPLKRIWPFIWRNLSSFHARMVCTKLDWNWIWARCFILKYFFQYTHVKIASLFWSPQPPGTIICTKMNLHYVRKLSCKSELFWLSGSRGENFSMTSPHFCIFVIISHLTKTWPFIWTIYNCLHLGMICTQLDWNWRIGSVEKMVFNIHICE